VHNADNYGDGDGKADRVEMVPILDKTDEKGEMIVVIQQKWEL
jgi:hypothetical protein